MTRQFAAVFALSAFAWSAQAQTPPAAPAFFHNAADLCISHALHQQVYDFFNAHSKNGRAAYVPAADEKFSGMRKDCESKTKVSAQAYKQGIGAVVIKNGLARPGTEFTIAPIGIR
jgi:hypothetical protein